MMNGQKNLSGLKKYAIIEAWRVAIQVCHDFIMQNPEYDISIFFAVLDSEMMDLGGKVFEEIVKKEI